MKQIKLKKIKSQRGAAAVEFALLLPVLVMIVLAIGQFGVGLNKMITINYAAREGARLAAVGKFVEADIIAIDPSTIQSAFIESGGGSKIGENVTVAVIGHAYQLEIPTFWFGPAINRSITPQDTATMRIEFVQPTP